MSDLQSIRPDELGVIAALLGVAPARSLSTDELNVLGNFLVAVGSIMLTVAAQEQFLKAHKAPKEEGTEKTVQQQIQELREQLQQLIDKQKR